MNNELWNQRLSFIWYNDAELFHYTDEDFDAQAKAYADGGINVVVTFSCTHFRYDFYKYWDVIFDCVAKMVKACHKYGIKVVDHASCTLTHNPLNDEDAKELLNTLRVRKSSLDSWPGLLDYVTNDERIVNNGYSMKDFRQIDGRTGEWARTPYSGWCCCYNNPYYKDSYIKYLDTMYERTGIDGYMADDMQFFAAGHACACEHCRKLFKEETGYDLPYPEDWGKFYGDYSNPVFVAWKRFKVRSTERFEREIYKHFLDKGVTMLRPCYMCHIVCSNWTAHCFEAASDLWNPVFQENMFSALMRYSFYDFHVEALHRYAMSTANNAPSFSLFYPDRHDNFYFAWALSSLWGQLLLATSEGTHNTDWEREFRAFENKHKNLYTNPKKI
nr:hypothetical protein [Clostridia bacterium]